MLKDRKVLVTGGAGFIGSHLVERLIKEGAKVSVLDDLSTGKIENLPGLNSIEFVRGDVTDRKLVEEVSRNTEVVVHLAALPSVIRSLESPAQTQKINAEGTLIMLEASVKVGVKRFVYASSSSVYGDTPNPKREDQPLSPISPYAVSKLAGEYLCKSLSSTYGLKCVILRFFNVYGPRQDPDSPYAAVIPTFIDRLYRNQPPPIFGTGKQSRDFTFVYDAVEGIMCAMEVQDLPYNTFNIACGRSISIEGLAGLIAMLMGVNRAPIYLPKRKGDLFYSCADISRAHSCLGFNPRFSFEDGLRLTINWFVNRARG
jgi:UDP-glucose 4-epimerase